MSFGLVGSGGAGGRRVRRRRAGRCGGQRIAKLGISILIISSSASARRRLPSSAIWSDSSIVAISSALAAFTASMSNTPRSISSRTMRFDSRRFSALDLSKLVGQVRGLLHGLGGLGRALDRHRLRQLGFPQRHGVDEGGVDLGHERLVVFLHQPDRGQRLHRHLARQLQVMDPAFQVVARGAQVAQFLRLDDLPVLGRGLNLGLLGGDGLGVQLSSLASPAAM
jgi:hypothetical protein